MLKKILMFLREQATAFEKTNPEATKKWNELAAEMEKAGAVDEVEATVKARIDSGDLIPKAKHTELVAAAEKTGRDAALKEVEEKATNEKKKTETTALRIKAIETAGLDPKFTIGKDRTIASVVASIPVGDEGDKAFEERKEEWTALRKATGQAAQGTASANGGKAPPMGGGATNGQKPGHAFI